MRKTLYLFCAVTVISLLLISCGGSEDGGETNMVIDESDYVEALSEEDQVKQGESDKEYYKRAKEEKDPTLCDKIEFIDLRNLCLQKTQVCVD